MRAFTDVEKQQLQAKIRDRAVATRFGTSNLSKFWTSNLLKYGLLAVIIGLLVCDVLLLLRRQNFGYDQYGNLVVALMILFQHIAFYFTKTGWPSRVMKTITWIWVVFGLAYIGVLYVTFVA